MLHAACVLAVVCAVVAGHARPTLARIAVHEPASHVVLLQDDDVVMQGITTGKICVFANACWTLPAATAWSAPRDVALSTAFAPRSVRVHPKWADAPPDQPPRSRA